MRRLAQILLVLVALVLTLGPLALLTGCRGPLDGAILAANTAREAGLVAAAELAASCTARYQVASADEVPSIDARCLPLARAYAAHRAAHLALAAVLVRAERGEPVDAVEVATLVARLADAGAALSEVVP